MTLEHPTRERLREIQQGDWRDARRDFNRADVERDEMDVDVLLVGAGPANLACAIRLHQLVEAHNASHEQQLEPEVMLLEKAATLGNHNLSGGVMDPRAFRELFGDETPIPGGQPVSDDGFVLLTREHKLRLWPLPPLLSNAGNVILSISQLVRWMGEHAEGAGDQRHARLRRLARAGRARAASSACRHATAASTARARPARSYEPGMNLKAQASPSSAKARAACSRGSSSASSTPRLARRRRATRSA